MFEQLFTDFVENLCEFDSYEVGITNEEGVFVASTSQGSLGKEAPWAVKMIEENETFLLCAETSEKYTILEIKGKLYGVLRVKGSADSLNIVSKLIANSLKMRIEVELNKKLENKTNTMEEQLVSELLHISEKGTKSIQRLSKDLGCDLNVVRGVILIKNQGSRRKFQMNGGYSAFKKEDLVAKIDENHYVILKAYEHAEDPLAVRKEAEKVIRAIKNEFGLLAHYFVSVPQDKFSRLATAYEQCTFLEENRDPSEEVVFIGDHLKEYFMSLIPKDKYEGVFETAAYKAMAENSDEFVNIFETLIQNDFNITQTSKALFMHKNSLIYKINKYRQQLHEDIIGSQESRAMLSYWIYWLKRNGKGWEE